MSRLARLALSLGLTLAGSAAGLIWMFGISSGSGFISTIFFGFGLLLPGWLSLLPMVLRFERMNLIRTSMFLSIGTLPPAAILTWETYFFFTHARGNRFPSHEWFLHEFACAAFAYAIGCLVYVLIIMNVPSQHSLTSSANIQSTR